MRAITIFILIILPYLVKAQDIIFSQMNESPVILNPANAGAQYDIRANLNYRQQWRSVTDPFITMAASADGKIIRQSRSSSLGVGLYIINDRAGGAHLNTFQSGIIASGKVPITNDQNISGGFGISFYQRHVDFSSLTWDKQFDGLVYNPDLPNGELLTHERTNGIDLSTGLQWSYGKGATTLSSNDNLGAQVGSCFSSE